MSFHTYVSISICTTKQSRGEFELNSVICICRLKKVEFIFIKTQATIYVIESKNVISYSYKLHIVAHTTI